MLIQYMLDLSELKMRIVTGIISLARKGSLCWCVFKDGGIILLHVNRLAEKRAAGGNLII